MISEEEIELSPSNAGAPATKWIVGICAFALLLQVSIVAPQTIYNLFALDPSRFPADWWTPVSYMFVHAGFWHLAVNMVTLWMFGSRLEAAWGTKKFLYFYLWCGIGGAVAHILFARDAGLVGASAAVSGVLLAYALRWPDDRVYLFGFIPMASRWLIAVMIGMNVALGLSAQTLIGWKAHLGGLAFGWLFIKAGMFGGTAGVRRWVSALPDNPEGMPRAIPRRSYAHLRAAAEREVAAARTARQELQRGGSAGAAREQQRRSAIDAVLEKISRDGLDSLTTQEKRLLDETSHRLREGRDTDAPDR